MSLNGWVGSFEAEGFRFGDPEDEDLSSFTDEQLLARYHQSCEGLIRVTAAALRDGWNPSPEVRASFKIGLQWFPHLKNLFSPEDWRTLGVEE